MNKTSARAVAQGKAIVAGLSHNSLGQAQVALETATRELKAAQDAMQKAIIRLQLAEEGHSNATTNLVAEFNTVRGQCKVTALDLK